MKTFLIFCLALLVSAVGCRPTRLTSLNFTSDQFDISWEEITEDLWP